MIALTIFAQASDNAAGAFLGLGMFGLLLALIATLFWLWMLFDAFTNSALDPTMRLVWAAVIFFLPVIGALAYLFVGRKKRSTP